MPCREIVGLCRGSLMQSIQAIILVSLVAKLMVKILKAKERHLAKGPETQVRSGRISFRFPPFQMFFRRSSNTSDGVHWTSFMIVEMTPMIFSTWAQRATRDTGKRVHPEAWRPLSQRKLEIGLQSSSWPLMYIKNNFFQGVSALSK